MNYILNFKIDKYYYSIIFIKGDNYCYWFYKGIKPVYKCKVDEFWGLCKKFLSEVNYKKEYEKYKSVLGKEVRFKDSWFKFKNYDGCELILDWSGVYGI